MRQPATIALFLITSLLLAAATAAAGVPFLPEIGVKAGLNLSNVDTDELDASTRTGVLGGAYIDLATPLLHVQPEVLISRRGFKDAKLSAGLPSAAALEHRSTILEVPILLVVALPTPMVQPRAFIGPALNLPLASEIRVQDEWTDIKDESKTAWSLVAGLGVKFGKFGVDLRYDIGLSAINDKPLNEIVEHVTAAAVSPAADYKDIKDRTFSVMVSYALF